MKKTIFIDLDGTILDVSDRIYQLYKDILKKHNKKFLGKNTYLKLKREKTSISKILKESNSENILPDYKKEWNKLIEKPHYLKLDKITLPKRQTLISLKKDYKLILVTLRNNQKEFFNQLKRKKIDKIFDNILIFSGKFQHSKWRVKLNLLKKEQFNKNSVIVGDTETDILAGRCLGIKTIAVINGMRSKRFLKEYKPNILIKNFSEIKNILNK